MGEWMEAYLDSKDNEPNYSNTSGKSWSFQDYMNEKKEWLIDLCTRYPEDMEFFVKTLGFNRFTNITSLLHLNLEDKDKNKIWFGVDRKTVHWFESNGSAKTFDLPLGKEGQRQVVICLRGIEYNI